MGTFLAAGTVVPGVGPIAKKIGKAAKDLAKGTSSVEAANQAKKLQSTAETAIKAEKYRNCLLYTSPSPRD